jgi:formate-dependent nitrite reductase membrane component NrfD
MVARGKKAALVLFLGDLASFLVALWLTLWVRYLELPSPAWLWAHVVALGPIFLIWTLIFFISDLYRQRTVVFERQVPRFMFRAQLINGVVAVLIFYFVPYFSLAGLTPKTNLLLILISTSNSPRRNPA